MDGKDSFEISPIMDGNSAEIDYQATRENSNVNGVVGIGKPARIADLSPTEPIFTTEASLMELPAGCGNGSQNEKYYTLCSRADTGDQDDDASEKPLLDLDRSMLDSTTSNMQTLMHLIKGNLGTGILALPLAFKHSGIWTGLAGVFLIGSIAVHCMHLLVKCSRMLCRRAGKVTMDYSDVAEYCLLLVGNSRLARLSWFSRVFVNCLLIFTQFGFCCVYIVFIATNVGQVIDSFTSNGLSLRVYEIIFTISLIPFVFLRKLEHLAPFSAFANILTMTGIVITFQYIVRGAPSVSERPAFSNIDELPLFIGTIFFSIEGISLVLPLENSMRTPQQFGGWAGVLNLGMVIVVALYAGMGFYGYLKFGDLVDPSITLSLPQDDWLYLSVKLMFAIAIYVSFGIQFYVPIMIMWAPFKKIVNNRWVLPLDASRAHQVVRNLFQGYGEYLFRVFFVLITFGFAAAIPHLDLLISLIGAFASSLLAIILPVLIELLTLWGESGHRISVGVWVKNVLIILFGLIGCFTGTYSSLKAIAEKF